MTAGSGSGRSAPPGGRRSRSERLAGPAGPAGAVQVLTDRDCPRAAASAGQRMFHLARLRGIRSSRPGPIRTADPAVYYAERL